MTNWIHKYISLAICGVLILISLIYTGIICYHYDITGDPTNPNWASQYYFFMPTRMCVYFMGCFVALLTIKPEKKAPEIKIQTNHTSVAPQNQFSTPIESLKGS